MKNSSLFSLALSSGWLLCPESLVMAGNSAGKMGWLTLPLLASVALLYTIANTLIQSRHQAATGCSKHLLLRNMIGNIPAAAFRLAGCVPLLILAATALLVTCGYTFNEVFLYWFPNFGFSFLLLALLSALQFFPESIILKAQVFFTGLAATGLLILSIYAIVHVEVPISHVLTEPANFSFSSSALLLLLFTGLMSEGNKQQATVTVPLIGFLIFSLWILASLSFVSPERLASSTIPYMTAARTIMGEPGRQIMGVIIISGTSAAVTGLMLICRQALFSMVKETPTASKIRRQIAWTLPPFIAISTGVLMATGLAGDEILETLLRGALLLWLIHYTLQCVAALFERYQTNGNIPYAGSICTCIFLTTVLILIFSNQHTVELLVFILSMLFACGLFTNILFFTHRRTNTPPLTKGKKL